MDLHRNFSSSRLVRLLSDATGVRREASGEDVAEKFSRWLNAFDAVKLHAVQQPGKAPAEGRSKADLRDALAALEAECHRVQTALVAAWRTRAAPAPEGDAAFAAHRQRYLEQQRQMELKIGPLRERTRQVLSRGPSRLRQLAALDAVLDQALAGREQRLLFKVPAHMEPRFEQRRQAGRLEDFEREWHELLLAELNVRLQPVLGMMEALGNEAKTQA